MKTKVFLQTTGLTILMMLLATLLTNAQMIPIQGLAVDHEGIAVWDADGTGPEPEGYAHPDPWGVNVGYYGASRDYDDIDDNPNAALCHFLDNITGFPLFMQALSDNGFTPGQVKAKTSLYDLKNDIEGEDWFILDNTHYYNRYDGYYYFELNGEPMISGYIYYIQSFWSSTSTYSEFKASFSQPVDASANSSDEIKAVAAAFLSDMNGQELRFVMTEMQPSGETFDGNGRLNGAFVNILEGHIEKGLPELPAIGLAADHEGLACWNADGTGPEPEAYGHTFGYGGTEWSMPYYIASRDYDDIDPDPSAGLGHFVDMGTGFPNLEVQLDYRGYTIDQLTSKTDIATLGNDVQGVDWGLDGNIHWYHTYGNTITFEIAGEPILECVIDTNYNFWNLDGPGSNWWSYTNYVTVSDISANASGDAQHVAASFLKDLGGHSLKFYSEGNDTPGVIDTNGRDGIFQEILNATVEAKLLVGTHIWENEVSGTWDVAGSPYIVMGPLNVPDGETLIIEPGVVVKFNTTEMFLINGCIIAEGTKEQPILFTALDHSVRWGRMGWDQPPTTNATSKLKHCIFEYAYAYNHENIPAVNSGGAIAVNNYNNIEINHCLFRHNLADKPGEYNPTGGAILLIESSFQISHCIFHDNQAGHGGAIAITTNSNPIIDNCVFYNNEAIHWYGGAILTYIDCSPTFVNCTFADNYALNRGGAVELQNGGIATFTNCIFWGNIADNGPSQISISDTDISFLNIYYCDVNEGLDGITQGFHGNYLNNLKSDPKFMGPGEESPYALSETSLCINAGFPADWYLIAELDILGNERIFGGNIDMGAYEYIGVLHPIIHGKYTEPRLVSVGDFKFNIYPNPVNSNPIIEFELINDGMVNISLLDVHGRIVSEILATELQSGKKQMIWNAEKLPPGVYFCWLQIANEIVIKKVIKME